MALTQMAKSTTNNGAKKLGPGTIRLILRTHGAAAEIARVAGVDPSYVYKVLHGIKPPSEKFVKAVGPALLNVGLRMEQAAFKHEYPRAATNSGRKGRSRWR